MDEIRIFTSNTLSFNHKILIFKAEKNTLLKLVFNAHLSFAEVWQKKRENAYLKLYRGLEVKNNIF